MQYTSQKTFPDLTSVNSSDLESRQLGIQRELLNLSTNLLAVNNSCLTLTASQLGTDSGVTGSIDIYLNEAKTAYVVENHLSSGDHTADQQIKFFHQNNKEQTIPAGQKQQLKPGQQILLGQVKFRIPPLSFNLDLKHFSSLTRACFQPVLSYGTNYQHDFFSTANGEVATILEVKQRENSKNEDGLLVMDLSDPNGTKQDSQDIATLLVVSDGMGGGGSGDVATKILLNTIANTASNTSSLIDLLNQASPIMQRLLKHDLFVSPSMGAAALAAKIVNNQLRYCHAGDVHIWIFRDSQLIHQSTDHTLFQQGVDQGIEPAFIPNRYRHQLYKYIGLSKGQIKEDNKADSESEPIELMNNDFVIIGSDGLGDVIDTQELGQLLAKVETTADLVTRLTNYDFITAKTLTKIIGRVRRGKKHFAKAINKIEQHLINTQSTELDLFRRLLLPPTNPSDLQLRIVNLMDAKLRSGDHKDDDLSVIVYQHKTN